MKPGTKLALVLLGVLALSIIGYRLSDFRSATAASALAVEREANGSTKGTRAPVGAGTDARVKAIARYKIDASQSKFMVRAFASGLLWFKGHDHFIVVRDFTGEAELNPGANPPASLQIQVRADSLVETSDVFTEQQKQIINKELREIVLEPAKYPEITFKSTDVTGTLTGRQFEAKIGGELTLHGVTRHIIIPSQVTLSNNGLRAQGEFTVNRSDYNVMATSAFHGLVRVRDKLKFTFDIVAHQI